MELEEHLKFIIEAHRDHPVKPVNRVRLWDKKTPYSIHPIWCTMTLLTETRLPEQLREEGGLALLYHDVLEDTTVSLPRKLSLSVKRLIQDMTFSQGITQEMRQIWDRKPKVRLLKLYDKISNLLDASWMDPRLRTEYEDYAKRLRHDAQAHFGRLNIITIAWSLLGEK